MEAGSTGQQDREQVDPESATELPQEVENSGALREQRFRQRAQRRNVQTREHQRQSDTAQRHPPEHGDQSGVDVGVSKEPERDAE